MFGVRSWLTPMHSTSSLFWSILLARFSPICVGMAVLPDKSARDSITRCGATRNRSASPTGCADAAPELAAAEAEAAAQRPHRILPGRGAQEAGEILVAAQFVIGEGQLL